MKTQVLFGLTTLLAGSLLTVNSAPKDDVRDAAKKLGEKANYSWTTTVTVPETNTWRSSAGKAVTNYFFNYRWTTTVTVPEGSRFRPGPTDGKTEKDGFTHLKMTVGDNTVQAVLKGDKAAFTNPDAGWQTLADLDTSQGTGRFVNAFLRGFKAPAAQAAELVAGAKGLKKDGDAYSSDLTEDAAKPLLTFGRRSGTDVTVSNAKGSVKFWIKDGLLSKYEFKISGKVTYNGNERDVDRTTTTEVKDVGSTKVEVSDEAKKKLESPAAAK